jgi:hypothetical protein
MMQKDKLEIFRALLDLSGHKNESCPNRARCCLSVLDAEVASWSLETLLDKHKNYDLHIVPKDPCEPVGFTIETCKVLGLNVYQPMEVHSKPSC